MQKGIMNREGLFRPDRVDSDFVVARTLLSGEECDLGELYVAVAEREFLDRAVRGIVALHAVTVQMRGDRNGQMKKLKQRLPKSLHYRIDPIWEQGGWADTEKFKLHGS